MISTLFSSFCPIWEFIDGDLSYWLRSFESWENGDRWYWLPDTFLEKVGCLEKLLVCLFRVASKLLISVTGLLSLAQNSFFSLKIKFGMLTLYFLYHMCFLSSIDLKQIFILIYKIKIKTRTKQVQDPGELWLMMKFDGLPPGSLFSLILSRITVGLNQCATKSSGVCIL